MNVSRRYPGCLLLALAVAVTALVIGAATAWGQSAPSDSPSSGGGVSGSGGSSGAVSSGTGVATSAGIVSSGIIAPAWCCGTTSSVPGLAVVGQATQDGQDAAARDVAIANAVQDATDQAQTAADAAGIQLGAILDLQVSAMPFYTPMMGETSGSSPGSPGSGAPEPMPTTYQSSVSVTITWAIGGV